MQTSTLDQARHIDEVIATATCGGIPEETHAADAMIRKTHAAAIRQARGGEYASIFDCAL